MRLSFVASLLVALPAGVALARSSSPTAARRFVVEQTYRVAAAPGAKVLTVWAPLPESDEWQTVEHLTIEGAPSHRVIDPRHRAVAARFDVQPAGGTLRVRFEVTRRERDGAPERATDRSPPPALAPELKPDRLVPVDDRVRALAAEVTRGAKTPLERAHRIYDYVLAHVRYDKSGEGWGRGDLLWVCDSGHGNCTDFHALLIGLARASGIPARFHIGYPVPSGDGGPIPGYHCWADLYFDGAGWVPVDASEAWKRAERRAFYFGHLDPDRFQLSSGRDLTLPGMKGDPLNYFVYPYAEADGKPAAPVAHETRFEARR